MAEHDHRSEKHEAEIRKFTDSKHAEYNLEEEHLQQAEERFNEKHQDEEFESKKI